MKPGGLLNVARVIVVTVSLLTALVAFGGRASSASECPGYEGDPSRRHRRHYGGRCVAGNGGG